MNTIITTTANYLNIEVEGYTYRQIGEDTYQPTCTNCGGDGLYHAPTHYTDHYGRAFCFGCNGYGASSSKHYTLAEATKRAISLNKGRARRDAKRDAKDAAAHAEYMAKELDRAHAKALRMEAATVWTHLTAEVGEKVTFTGTIVRRKTIDTVYGTSLLVIIEDAETMQTVKTFTTAQWAWSTEVDQVVTVTGSVKSFEEYENKKSTLLTRVKAVA